MFHSAQYRSIVQMYPGSWTEIFKWQVTSSSLIYHWFLVIRPNGLDWMLRWTVRVVIWIPSSHKVAHNLLQQVNVVFRRIVKLLRIILPSLTCHAKVQDWIGTVTRVVRVDATPKNADRCSPVAMGQCCGHHKCIKWIWRADLIRHEGTKRTNPRVISQPVLCMLTTVTIWQVLVLTGRLILFKYLISRFSMHIEHHFTPLTWRYLKSFRVVPMWKHQIDKHFAFILLNRVKDWRMGTQLAACNLPLFFFGF